MELETRSFGAVELRAAPDGRTLSGVVVPYSTVSPSHRETFMPGSVRTAPRGVVNASHDRSRPISGWPGAVEFTDTAEGLSATITVDDTVEAREAVEEVRAGKLTGFSVEFNRAVAEMVGGVRQVKEAVLVGLAVVSAASYPGTAVELRKEDDRRKVWIT